MVNRKKFTLIHAALFSFVGGSVFWYLLFKVVI